jgi:GR25 family glycosyltransferase involved in LPS biosynthesis
MIGHNGFMKAFVINLQSRTDRWEEVCRQRELLGVEIYRVEALTEQNSVSSPFVTGVISATWQSHQRALKEFLQTSDDFAFILEDDFILLRNWDLENLQICEEFNVDFLQLGFLITNLIDRIQFTLNQFVDLTLKLLNRITYHLPYLTPRLSSKLTVREQSGIPFRLVLNDIRPGAHAYIVSRRFAEAALKINSPEFLSADAVYISMGWMRSFNMLRMRSSHVGQSNSISSINVRFLNS